MKSLGNFSKKYGTSQLLYISLLLPPVLSTVAAVWLLALSQRVVANKQHILLIAAATLLLIALAFFVVRNAFLPKSVFELYENGIRVIHVQSKQEQQFLFTELNEIVRFVSGKAPADPDNLAFRKTGKDPWNIITPKTANSADLIKRFLEKHLEQQGQNWLQQLESGKRIHFRYIPPTSLQQAGLFVPGNKHFLQAPEQLLSLDKYTLNVQDKTYAIEEIGTVQVADWRQSIQILEKSGQRIFTLPYLSLFNADLFVQLINSLIKK